MHSVESISTHMYYKSKITDQDCIPLGTLPSGFHLNSCVVMAVNTSYFRAQLRSKRKMWATLKCTIQLANTAAVMFWVDAYVPILPYVALQ